MSSDSENQSSFLLLLLKHLNQTNSDSLETLERENLHFVITDNLIATFEEIKCDIFFNKNQSHLEDEPLETPSKSSDGGNSGNLITSHLIPEDNSSSSTPTPSSGSSSSVPSSYQDGTVLSTSDWLTEQRNSGSDDFSTLVRADGSSNSKTEVNHEGPLHSFSESISNLSEISSCVTVDRDAKVLTEITSLRPLDDFESADNSAESVAVQLLSNYSQRPFSSSRRASLQPLMMSSPTSGDEPTRNSSSRSLPIRRSGSSCYSLYSNTSPVVTNTSFRSLLSLHQVPSAATRSNIKLRGNSLWAPLRPQLICNIQRPADKYSQWISQNQRCAGCGFHIDSKCKEFNDIMYCYYTGKFFCRVGCHSGRKAILPAFVIQKWDFNRYPVSNFAVTFLERIRGEPLFHINDQNASLYKRVKRLGKLLDIRCQLKSLREYISTCKNAADFIFVFNSFEPQHFIRNDIHCYSLEDLITIKDGSSKKLLERCWTLVKESISHVSECEYCKARGFFCELCNKKDILFPFEIGRVYQCADCHACYHLNCFKNQANQKCSKCSRIQARRCRDSHVQPIEHNTSDISNNDSLQEVPEPIETQDISQPSSPSLTSHNNNSTNAVNS